MRKVDDREGSTFALIVRETRSCVNRSVPIKIIHVVRRDSNDSSVRCQFLSGNKRLLLQTKVTAEISEAKLRS